MLDLNECEVLASFFALLSNRTRLRMLCVLRDGRHTVSELAEAAGVSLQNVSQHLRLMRDKGIVLTEREGQRVYYRLSDPRLVQAAELLRAAVTDLARQRWPAQWQGAPEEKISPPAGANVTASQHPQSDYPG